MSSESLFLLKRGLALQAYALKLQLLPTPSLMHDCRQVAHTNSSKEAQNRDLRVKREAPVSLCRFGESSRMDLAWQLLTAELVLRRTRLMDAQDVSYALGTMKGRS